MGMNSEESYYVGRRQEREMADTGRQANWLAYRMKERMSDERVTD